MIKVVGLKARNSIRKRLKHMYFHVNFTHFFPKTLFMEQFWMTASADSSAPTKVLSHFYDHTFLHVFPFIIDIIGKGIPARPPFLRQSHLDPACPLFKIFVCLLSFLFHPLLRYFRQFPPFSHNLLLSYPPSPSPI